MSNAPLTEPLLPTVDKVSPKGPGNSSVTSSMTSRSTHPHETSLRRRLREVPFQRRPRTRPFGLGRDYGLAKASAEARAAEGDQLDSTTCGLMIFDHVEKTGGSTVRSMLEEPREPHWHFLSSESPCHHDALYAQHWWAALSGRPHLSDESLANITVTATAVHEPLRRVIEHHLPHALELLQEVASKFARTEGQLCATARLPPLHQSRFALEYHGLAMRRRFTDMVLPLVPALRSYYRRQGCTFTLFTLLREPQASILSYWNHFQRLEPPRFQNGLVMPLAFTAETERAEILMRMFQFGQLVGAPGSRGPRVACGAGTPWPAPLSMALSILEQLYDLVGITGLMDASLLSLQHLSGYPHFRAGRFVNQRAYHDCPQCGALRQVRNRGQPMRLHARRRQVLNASRALAAASLTVEELSTLERSTRCDRLLYARAYDRFMAAARPGLLGPQLQEFRSMPPQDRSTLRKQWTGLACNGLREGDQRGRRRVAAQVSFPNCCDQRRADGSCKEPQTLLTLRRLVPGQLLAGVP